MKYFIWFLSILVITALLMLQCGPKEENVVQVGAYTISKSDIVDLLKKKYPDQSSFSAVDLSVKKDILEPLIVRKLYLNEAFKNGLDNDPEFKENFENFQVRILGGKYFERMIVDNIINEDMLDDAITRQGVELKASHILIAHAKSPRPVKRTPEEARLRALDVIQRLKKGEDFSTLVAEFSDDPSAKTNKGDLGYFVWGKMVSAFFDASWKLEIGQISEPVESQYGYHIIRLDDRRPIKDYVENRSEENLYRTKQTLMRNYGDSARVLWKKQYDKLLAETDYRLFEDKISEFADTLKTIIKDEQLTADVFPESLRSMTLAEWDGDKITVASLLEKYRTQLPRIFGNFRDPAKLTEQIKRITMDNIVLRDAKKLGLQEEESVAKELNAYTENQMVKLIENKRIKEKVEVTDDEIFAYYEKNKDSFIRPEEIEIWEIDVSDKNLADGLLTRARKGENFEALARKYTEDTQLKKKSGYLGFKNKSGRGSISQTAHDLGPGGKIGGPVKYGRFWVVLKTGKMNDEIVRPLDEVKSRINNLVKTEKIKEEKLAWERELREVYKVAIDEAKLKEL
jgi:parvulin-like peptidyl-prolyl isomerase